MALPSNQYAFKLQWLLKISAQKAAPKLPEWPSYDNFLQGHPKPAFSLKVQRRDQEKFFKNHPKK